MATPDHASPTPAALPEAKHAGLIIKRMLDPRWSAASYGISVALALFMFYGLFIEPLDPWVFRCAYLTFASILIFIHIPARAGSPSARASLVDLIWIAAAVAPLGYLLFEFEDLYYRAAGGSAEIADIVFGTIAVIVVLETTRRSCGIALTIIALIFILYAFVGPYLPGLFWNRGYSYERVVGFLYSTVGIYTTPLGISARYVFIFIFFGALLQRCGAGDLFVDLAKSVVGKSRGGVSKVPLFSSVLFGSISGAAVANVVTTGSITIPAMKREGVPPHVAGAIEAVASTGGQLMPPVMGAAAFLMAEMLGIPYGTIVTAALIPACLYYLSIYFALDFEAAKSSIHGLPEEPPALRNLLLKQGYLLVPLIVIVYVLVVEKSSPNRAAMFGIIATMIVSWFAVRSRITPKGLVDTMAESGPAIMEIAATTAAAGIVIGILSLTGLGVKAAAIIIGYAQGSLMLALVLAMIISLVLGLGLPTVAAYAMAAAVVPPALVELGASELAAHMFIFYFCVLATITPPVAIASFAAAALARANIWAVGFKALMFGLAGFIIPFMFVYGRGLLMEGSVATILWSTCTASIGILALAGALQGWMYGARALHVLERLALFSAALLLIHHAPVTDTAGFILFGGAVAVRVLLNRSNLRRRAERLASSGIE